MVNSLASSITQSPNWGLIHIGTSLLEHNHAIEYVDSIDKIPKGDIYFISSGTRTFYDAIRLRQELDKMTVIGGHHVTYTPIEALEYFDLVWQGHFNYDLFINALKKSKTIVTNKDKCHFGNITWFDTARYNNQNRIKEGRGIDFIASAGCPYNCSFCTPSSWGISLMDKKTFAQNISFLADRFDNIGFCDNTIFGGWLKRYGSILRNLNIKWGIPTRPEAFMQNWKLLKEIGCTHVGFGIETGSNRLLSEMNKKTNVETYIQATELAKAKGFDVKWYIMIGFPTETCSDFQKTYRLLKKYKDYIDTCAISMFVPFPGCDIYEHPQKYGVISVDKDFGSYCPSDFKRMGRVSFTCKNFERNVPIDRQQQLVKLIGEKHTLEK